ncbi:hypothetical protein AHAS_Ahas19G0291100 [Arachis hypogaea]
MLINVKLISAYISRLYLPSASSSTTKMKRDFKNKYTVSPRYCVHGTFGSPKRGIRITKNEKGIQGGSLPEFHSLHR